MALLFYYSNEDKAQNLNQEQINDQWAYADRVQYWIVQGYDREFAERIAKSGHKAE